MRIDLFFNGSSVGGHVDDGLGVAFTKEANCVDTVHCSPKTYIHENQVGFRVDPLLDCGFTTCGMRNDGMAEPLDLDLEILKDKELIFHYKNSGHALRIVSQRAGQEISQPQWYLGVRLCSVPRPTASPIHGRDAAPWKVFRRI